MNLTTAWPVLVDLFRSVIRPFIAWSAQRAKSREVRRRRITPLLLLLVLCTASGCATYDRIVIGLDKLLPPYPPPAATNDVPTATVPPGPGALVEWPAYDAPTYFGHGYASENTYREAAIAGARAAGLDAIRVICPTAPGPELAMHLLYYQSPVDGHFMNASESWYQRALAAGVRRYVIDIGNGQDRAAWLDRTKAYPPGTIQWIVNGVVKPQGAP